MKAWPAADEEKADGVIDAVIGVAALIAALILDANPLWLVLPAVAFAGLALRSSRGTSANSSRRTPRRLSSPCIAVRR